MNYPSVFSASMKSLSTYFYRFPAGTASGYATSIAAHIDGAIKNGEYTRLDQTQLDGLKYTAKAVAEVAVMAARLEAKQINSTRRLTRWQRFVSVFQKG